MSSQIFKYILRPRNIILTSIGTLISSAAIFDYNRKIYLSLEESKEFEKNYKSQENLGELLETTHSKTNKNIDSILANRFYFKEFYYFHKHIENEKEIMKKDPLIENNEINTIINNNFSVLGKEMCRRAMLRNHNYIKWFKAIVKDELLEKYSPSFF